jgi:hypothetical protein
VFDVLVTKMGFTRCAVQPCFYRHEKDDVDVEVHQDDFYATAPGTMLSRFAEEILTHMKLKISPLLQIGMRYSHLKCGRSRLQDGMYISGNVKYTVAILESLKMETCKSAVSPIVTQLLNEDKEDMCESEEATLFRHCVGVARFLVNSRPDLIFVVHILSKRLSAPCKADIGRLRHLARYLQGTRDLAIWFPVAGDYNIMECFCDTDWAGDKIDRKSVGCGVIQCGGCTLVEFARGQAVTGLSSGETEYYGIASVSSEAIFIKHVLTFMNVHVQIRVQCDSTAAKSIAQRIGVGRIRHLEVKTLWVQEKVKAKELVVVKVPGEENVADIGTKAVPGPRFLKLRDMLGLRAVGAKTANVIETKAELPKVGMISNNVIMDLMKAIGGLLARL